LGGWLVNITKITEEFVNQHPSIKDCLRQDLINFSKLSRKIQHEKDIKNFEAIVIASRRLKEKIVHQEDRLEKKLIYLLKNSKIEVKNKIIVTVIEKNIFFDHIIELQEAIAKKNDIFHVIQGSDTITIITPDSYLPQIKSKFKHKILKISEDLIEVALKTEESIEETPGWVAYLTTRLAENNINIIETMSAWTETIFVLHKEDIAKTMDLLQF